jgi:hypothetical protein
MIAHGEAFMATGNRYVFRVRPGMRQGLATETPIPSRLISNEEFPRPKTAEQQGSSITSWTRPAGWRPAWG